MTYCAVNVELTASSEAPELQLRELSDVLRRTIVAAASDFVDSHQLPRGVVLVLNGEAVPEKEAVNG